MLFFLQILTERSRLPPFLKALLSQHVPENLFESLTPGTEFWTAEKIIKFLQEGDFFLEDGRLEWPSGLASLVDTGRCEVVCVEEAVNFFSFFPYTNRLFQN